MVRTPSVANMSLTRERNAFERMRLALGDARVARLRHGVRALRRLQHIGVERARPLHRDEMRLGKLGGGELLLLQAVAGARDGERGQLGHSGSSHLNGDAACGAAGAGAAAGLAVIALREDGHLALPRLRPALRLLDRVEVAVVQVHLLAGHAHRLIPPLSARRSSCPRAPARCAAPRRHRRRRSPRRGASSSPSA